jgi:ATP-dependent helicase/nuclease subunit B
LLRLDALLGGLGLADALTPSLPWLAWARARDRHDRLVQRPAPAPRPPVARRPRKLAVTEVERWIANPYAIYARHVLRLEALPLLGVEPGAALKGAILHDALGRFAKRHPSGLPDQIADELMADVERVLKSYAAHPRVAAFWRPRFRRFAAWFAETEAARRAGVTHVHAERPGKHVFKASIAPFTLTARADRIDVTPDGLAITDYKTGAPPSGSRVSAGQAPQLPLEALIAASGGFVDVPAAAVMQLKYIRASGGDPPGEEVVPRIEDLQALIAAVHDGMEDLIVDYDKPSTPYRALRRASFGQAYHYDDYAHLARVREWAGGSGESE